MFSPLRPFGLALWLACSGALQADDAPKLVSRVIRVPMVELREPSVDMKPLAPCADGERRCDVGKYLEMRGVVLAPEFSAIVLEQSGVVVVRGPRDQVDLADYVLREFGERTLRGVTVEVNLWEYLEAPSPAPAPPAEKQAPAGRKTRGFKGGGLAAETLADLQKQAGESLRRLDSVMGAGVLGEQISITSKLPGPGKAGAALEQSGIFTDDSRGRSLQLEALRTDDPTQLSISVGYRCRWPQGLHEPDVVEHVRMARDFVNGQEAILSSRREIIGEKVKVRVLTVAAYAKPRVEPPAFTPAEIEKFTRRAEEGVLSNPRN